MCGIAGLMLQHSPASDQRNNVEIMARSLTHRGPDNQGFYSSDNVIMGHTRLSIVDIDTGNQPLIDGGNLSLVANGEIYNHQYIRDNSLNNISFSTRSDCEVILHLYAKDKLGMIPQLRGMYAFALHDRKAEKLIIARDPFGIKPLYYVENDAGFVFASEAQALIQGGFAVRSKLAKQSLTELVSVQFTIGRDTIFEDIKRILPGESLIIHKGKIVERKMTPALPNISSKLEYINSEPEALRALDEAIMDSVNIHQLSDVQYGMFLSGGVDSSALLYAMSRLNEKPVIALTAGFKEDSVPDERERARSIARAVGAEHINITVSEHDFLSLMPRIIMTLDDPIADYAILPTYILAQKASERGLKVVLSGEGGDELFGGYGRYRSAMRSRWFGGPKSMRAHSVLGRLGIMRNFSETWRDRIGEVEGLFESSSFSLLQRAQLIDCMDWLPNNLLVKLDRCLMAHGVEGRTPFLDRQIADVAFSLPDHMKVRRKKGKWLLRQWLNNKLPDACAFEKKRGFTVPIGPWVIQNGNILGNLVSQQPGVLEICLPDKVRSVFRASDKRNTFAAWILLFYALWHQIHVLGCSAEGNIFDCLSA